MQNNNQFEARKHFSTQVSAKEILYENIPRIQYEFFFKLFGLLSSGAELRQRAGPVKKDRSAVRLRRVYCQAICTLMWLFTVRSFVLMFIDNREWQVWMGDLSGYWNSYRMYYLMPSFFICLQTALTCTGFLAKERQLAWLVPFLSVKQLQVNNSRVTTDPKPYRLRINLCIIVCLLIVIGSSGAVTYLFAITALEQLGPTLFRWWLPWLIVQAFWFMTMSGITLLTVAYFNLVCLVIAGKFADVCKEIETLADSDPGPPGSKNDQLNQLYYDHNEVCELVDESNSFWQSYIFYTFMTYIPCACYVLYNLFFAEFDFLLAAYTWSTFFLTLVLLAIICISAADVSAEVSPFLTRILICGNIRFLS
jgi:hypothetical protein